MRTNIRYFIFQVRNLKYVKVSSPMKKIHLVFQGLLLSRNREQWLKTLKSNTLFLVVLNRIGKGTVPQDPWKVNQSKDFTAEYNGNAHINRMEGSAETCSWVGGGGRTAFLKPLAHSHWRSRLNINQTMSLHSIKPASVFPLHFKCSPISAVWPTGPGSSGASLLSQPTAHCLAHWAPVTALDSLVPQLGKHLLFLSPCPECIRQLVLCVVVSLYLSPCLVFRNISGA